MHSQDIFWCRVSVGKGEKRNRNRGIVKQNLRHDEEKLLSMFDLSQDLLKFIYSEKAAKIL